MRRLFILLAALSALLLSACVSHQPHHYGYEQGPPPHAPAHGYRAKHGHHDLVYDSGLGAYVVLGYDDLYYLDDHYYRFHDGYWLYSRYIDDDWRRIDYDHVPSRLRHSRDHGDRDHKHRGRGRGYDDHGEHPGKGHGRGREDDWD